MNSEIRKVLWKIFKSLFTLKTKKKRYKFNRNAGTCAYLNKIVSIKIIGENIKYKLLFILLLDIFWI